MALTRKLKFILKDSLVHRWIIIITKHAKDFCLSTDLHGYKYIGQSQRSKTERCVWAVILISSLCCSFVFMKRAYEYNASHSTLTIIESTHHGIWNFPFPAVTICNINQVSLRKAGMFVNKLKDLKGLTREYILQEMRLLLEMLDPGVFEEDVHYNLTLLESIFEANNYTAVQVMKLVKQNCSALIRNCKWRGNSTPCNKIFEETYARDGFCCSFNYFHSNSRINYKRKPKRVSACGYQTGLTFQVYPEPKDYFATLFASYGVKVITHYPYEYPVRSSEFKLVGLGVQSFLSVTPEETYSTDNIKQLGMQGQGCNFDGDELPSSLRELSKYSAMSKYSYANCLNDCRTKVIVSECGCVPYYIPQNGGARVCNLRDLTCLKNIRHIYDTSWPGLDLNSVDIPDTNIDISKKPCGCLTDCTVTTYPIDSTQGFLNDYSLEYDNSTVYDDNKNFSIINVFFTDLVAIRYRRDIYYNWRNLFASFGGLLGLFAGFTIMSCFELIYFFVIRIIVEKYIKRKEIIT